jgi:hypothetical protein
MAPICLLASRAALSPGLAAPKCGDLLFGVCLMMEVSEKREPAGSR